VLVSERVAAPFVSGDAVFTHGLTFGAHPLTTSVALAALDIYEREDVLANVRANEPFLRAGLEELRRVPIVGDVRGAGAFWSVELVKDRTTRQTWEEDEASWLLRDILTAQMDERGLLCRLDDRGDPVIQLSPPLVADRALLDSMISIVGAALEAAWAGWQDRATRAA
jgi:adenosylmethionine-8-amino-7-oxononanoate aminotransferase